MFMWLSNWLPEIGMRSLLTVTVAELMFGALRSRKSQESIVICRQFCSAFQLVDFGQGRG